MNLNLLLRPRMMVLASCYFMGAGAAHAVLYYASGDPTYQSSAPTGAYVGSGWQYQGIFGSVLGTAISSSHFITAVHTDPNSLISQFQYEGDSFQIISREVIPGTDLMVLGVDGAFSQWASLYTGSDLVGQELVTMGRGGARSSAITGPNGLQGWQTQNSDGVMRWGTNDIDGVLTAPGLGELFYATFDAASDEAGLSRFDSGGGVFVKDTDGEWKLAGINYGVDTFSTSATGASPFIAALFDPTGFYRSVNGVWTLQTASDPGSRYYFSSVSASAGEIYAIAGVPEPSVAGLTLAGSSLFLLRRRPRK